MTHQDLCRLAVKWLKNKGKCHVAVSEISTGVEIPDAIGYTKNKLKTSRALALGDLMHICTMVEAKMSRSDFLQDAKKAVQDQTRNGRGYSSVLHLPSGAHSAGRDPGKLGSSLGECPRTRSSDEECGTTGVQPDHRGVRSHEAG